jgi:hypothetical protein
MINAILAGRKSQTRRVCKNPKVMGPHEIQKATHVVKYEPKGLPPEWSFRGPARFPAPRETDSLASYGLIHCPYGQPGDRLWCREAFWTDRRDPGVVVYDATPEWGKYKNAAEPVRSTHPDETLTTRDEARRAMLPKFWSKRSPLFMPRWASRLTLEITEVRVERVQAISEEDARAEGLDPMPSTYTADFALHGYVDAFAERWDELNGPRGFSWASNPFVWVIGFRRTDASNA